MKYCPRCGEEVTEEDVYCPKCGANLSGSIDATVVGSAKKEPSTLSNVAYVFLIVGTVLMAISTFAIGLAWCLPMLFHYRKARENGEQVSIAFKVCTLIFVSQVAGILMLCDVN